MDGRASSVTDNRHQLDIWRCSCCGRILAQVDLRPGCTIKIKCACNAVNVLQVVDTNNSAQTSQLVALSGL